MEQTYLKLVLRKTMLFLTFSVLFIFIYGINASAASYPTTAAFSVEKKEVPVNEAQGTITVDFTLDTDTVFNNAGFDFTYDNGITLKSIKAGAALVAVDATAAGNPTIGRFGLSYTPTNFASDPAGIGSGTICTLTFEVADPKPGDLYNIYATNYTQIKQEFLVADGVFGPAVQLIPSFSEGYIAIVESSDLSQPTITEPTNLTATYLDMLHYIKFDDTAWSWKTPNVNVGNVGINSFDAIYTPYNPDSYDWTNISGWDPVTKTVTRTLSVTVNKRRAGSIGLPGNLKATIGDTLSTVTLHDNWYWESPETTLNNAGNSSYPAYYKPTENLLNNYDYSGVDGWDESEKIVRENLIVNVAKKPADEIMSPTNLTATARVQLSTVILPDKWSWNSPDSSVGAYIGNAYFSAFYTPTAEELETTDFSTIDGWNSVKNIVERELTVNVTEPTPTPTPTPGATPTPTPTPGVTPTPTPTSGATPTPTPTSGATPTPTPTSGATPTPTTTSNPTASPSPNPSTGDSGSNNTLFMVIFVLSALLIALTYLKFKKHTNN